MQTSVYVREQTTSGAGKAYYKYRRIKEGQGAPSARFHRESDEPNQAR